MVVEPADLDSRSGSGDQYGEMGVEASGEPVITLAGLRPIPDAAVGYVLAIRLP